LKTLAPPSEAPPINLGEWISINPFFIKNSLNKKQTPAYNLKIAYLAGVLRSIILLSNLVFIPTLGSALGSFDSSFDSSFSSTSAISCSLDIYLDASAS